MEAIEVAQKGVEVSEERSEFFNRIINFLKNLILLINEILQPL
jgi:hypothetical protein